VRVPIGWLRDYVDLDVDTDTLVARLAMLGFPVESVERRPHLAGVVAGRIEKVEKHPNADRLAVCTIDVGGPAKLVIATAATNVAEAQVVPVAVAGAQLADEQRRSLRIERRAMRGVESDGMLCSAFELALESTWFEDGIMQLDADTPLGVDVVAHFRLTDDVLDVEVTPNRVDAMSIVGIARELGAAFGRAAREPVAGTPVRTLDVRDASDGVFRLRIESPDCRRFVAQRFSSVRVRQSPAWMRIRLALAGQRPINNVVDVSNFVMLEIGQPQHFYDLDRLAGRRLVVRDARDGETIRTLDGEERTLTPRALVIADADEPQCLAGLMGAAASEVSEATREIVAESANFSGPRIRRMAIAQGLRTDAAARHERGLALEMPDVGAARAAELLRQQGATPREAFAVGTAPGARPEIALRGALVRELSGIDASRAEIAHALGALGFAVRSEADRDQMGDEFETILYVAPPYWRSDVSIPADVVEEIARIVGYDRIEPVQPPVQDQAIPSDAYRTERRIASAFATGGYREVMTLSLQPARVYERFTAAGISPPGPPVEIVNPLSEDQRYLRFSLVPGLLALAAKDEARAPLRLFEVGHVFERAASPAEGDNEFEIAMTAWMYVSPKRDEPAWRDSGFLAFKGDTMAIVRAMCGRDADAVTGAAAMLHPEKTAAVLVDGRDVASIGAVDPRLLAEYEIERPVYVGLMLTDDLPSYRVPQYRPQSRFPSVERDLSLIVAPDVPAHEIVHVIRESADGIARGVLVFDEYRGAQVGPDRKSIAVRITLQRDDATLTDAEVDSRVAAILTALRERIGAEIRS
jgi:phenylalanyl-tRNA synthetase beta chain